MAAPKSPTGLRAGGKNLWATVVNDHDDLTITQLVQLEEACRAKDRLDQLDEVLRGDGHTWMKLVEDFESDQISELRITNALVQANATANLMKQLIAALRLPDEVTGKKPQRRGPRGAQVPTVPGGKVSSLDRARAAKSG